MTGPGGPQPRCHSGNIRRDDRSRLLACENDARFDELPLRERLGYDACWRAAHAVGTALPGWLVLVPRRHVTAIAELTDAEAAGLGRWQVAPP